VLGLANYTLKDVIDNCKKFNRNSEAGETEFKKIKELLELCGFKALRSCDNVFIMSLEKDSQAWIIECRMTTDYNMFIDWKSPIESAGYKGLLNLSKTVWEVA
jgi:hypothetical protein